jgi:Terminase large subunit, T4likevirus-type, N-terminal
MSSQKHNESSKNPLLLQATRNLIARLAGNEAADPVLLAQRAGLGPDAWQADVLRSPAHQLILNVTRQGGKSTISSIRALHRALYRPGSLVLLLAPAYRQSKELFRKIQDAYNSLHSSVRLTSESALEMEFINRSRIVALPGKEGTIRGFSGVSSLIVDEAARVPDELYQAIRPMLAVSGGDILLLSTPFGKRGFFHHEWTEGRDWHKTQMTAYDCPRISKEWLELERQSMPDWWFRQEYMCEFMETTDQVFSYDDIQRALDSTVKPLFGVAA